VTTSRKKAIIGISIGFVALLVAAFVASIFSLGSFVKNRIETIGPRVAQVGIKLDSADVWLLTGRARLKGLYVGNPPGCKSATAIKVGDISVRLNPLSALSEKIIIDSITVTSPEINLEGGLKKNNLTKIQQNVNDYVRNQAESSASESKPAASPAAAGKPGRKFQINELVITGSRLRIASLFSTGVSVTVSLPDIRLDNLGEGPGGITSPEVAQKALTALLNSIAANAADTAKKFDFKKAGERLKGLIGE
jgi:uncharacterized protein involved in outer membrane biogenesis